MSARPHNRGFTALPDPELVPVLRIEEALPFLGVGRSVAYEACREYLRTDGASGIPTIRLGNRLLIPTAALRRFLQVDE